MILTLHVSWQHKEFLLCYYTERLWEAPTDHCKSLTIDFLYLCTRCQFCRNVIFSFVKFFLEWRIRNRYAWSWDELNDPMIVKGQVTRAKWWDISYILSIVYLAKKKNLINCLLRGRKTNSCKVLKYLNSRPCM